MRTTLFPGTTGRRQPYFTITSSSSHSKISIFRTSEQAFSRPIQPYLHSDMGHISFTNGVSFSKANKHMKPCEVSALQHFCLGVKATSQCRLPVRCPSQAFETLSSGACFLHPRESKPNHVTPKACNVRCTSFCTAAGRRPIVVLPDSGRKRSTRLAFRARLYFSVAVARNPLTRVATASRFFACVL